jgi:hypothetical protein
MPSKLPRNGLGPSRPGPGGSRTPRSLPVCRIARDRLDGSSPAGRASAHPPWFRRPEYIYGGLTHGQSPQPGGMSNSPACITHPSNVARLSSMPVSRSGIVLCQYSGKRVAQRNLTPARSQNRMSAAQLIRQPVFSLAHTEMSSGQTDPVTIGSPVPASPARPSTVASDA